MNDSCPPRPVRRWYQFSLRTLLVFVLLVSVGMSWFATRMQRARRQFEARRSAKRAGFSTYYEYQIDEQDPPARFPLPKSPIPPLLLDLLGEDFFHTVEGIESIYYSPNPAPKKCLKVLDELRYVDLSRTEDTDAGLEHLKASASLEWLDLKDSDVTDAGLKHLMGFTNLECLDLVGTRVTDAGLEHLEGATRLKWLDLAYSDVTNAGMKHLKGSTNLEWLHLGGTRVTDAGLMHLKGLTKLRTLGLAYTKVTDAGLVHLKGLTKLRTLGLAYTKVTDAGLEHLEGSTNLRELHLPGRVSDEAVKKLQDALPNCRISETTVLPPVLLPPLPSILP